MDCAAGEEGEQAMVLAYGYVAGLRSRASGERLPPVGREEARLTAEASEDFARH
jgi:hypothetical protein